MGLSWPRVYLLLTALPFAGIGAAFLVAPVSMGQHIGLELPSAVANQDVRAVYGGMQLGIAVFLVAAMRREEWTRPGLAVAVLVFGALALGRFVGWLDVGLPEQPIGFALHAAELVGCALGVHAWLRAR